MPKLRLSMFALLALAGNAVFAQSITGTWQGTLKVNGPNGSSVEVRTVIKIARADNEGLKAVLYTIDQDPTPLSTTSVTFKGSVLKISLTQMNGAFEGTLGGNGNTLKGKLTQGNSELPLNLVRATDATAWIIPEPPPGPVMMTATLKPEFMVATIKPSPANQPGRGFGFRGQDVTTINTTATYLIKLAFNLHVHQIVGGPSWLDSDKYDVLGRPDTPGQPNRDQMKLMLQKLLVDRFQLKFHIEKRELPVYAMVPIKGGAKVAVSAGDPNAFPGLGFAQGPGVLSLVGNNTTFDGVANALQSNILDKPVVNQTGLTGRYDFTLRFTPDQAQITNFGTLPPGNAANPDNPPDIFAAFQQQLGLKLESTKALVDVMVIERIERPSEN